jgi:hypothetical protein
MNAIQTQQQQQTPAKKPKKQSMKRFKCDASPIVTKQPTLTRQTESFTFIADLASTSTPTKKPIVSTPKARNHDPSKYHPTQTIRNKLVKHQQTEKQRIKRKKQQHQQIKIKYEKAELVHMQQRSVKSVNNIEKYFAPAQKPPCTKRMLSERELISCRCCPGDKATPVPASKKARYSIEPPPRAIANVCNLSEFVVSAIVDKDNLSEISLIKGNVMGVMMRKKTSSCSRRTATTTGASRKSSRKINSAALTTGVAVSSEKITLKDLMYTPSKLRRLEGTSTGVLAKIPIPLKSSKVYYL